MAELGAREFDIGAIRSLQGSRTRPLDRLLRDHFNDSATQGRVLQRGEQRLLQLAPQEALLLGNHWPPEFETAAVDVTHAYIAFRLDGEQAFDFANDYTTADLATLRDQSGCLRCRLGQYVVILWHDDSDTLKLLLERSYAHSFADDIARLIARWRPRAHVKLTSPTGEGSS